jgi:hypothetical protein
MYILFNMKIFKESLSTVKYYELIIICRLDDLFQSIPSSFSLKRQIII